MNDAIKPYATQDPATGELVTFATEDEAIAHAETLALAHPDMFVKSGLAANIVAAPEPTA